MSKREGSSGVAEYASPSLPPGTVDAALEHLFPKSSAYRDDAALWIRDRLQAHIWSKQQEICESVSKYTYTGVKACHGPGKSYITARIGCWWLDPLVHPLGSAFVVTTAPSWPQVQAILWRELRRAHREAQLPGRITLDCHWYMGEGRTDEELIAIGRKPADYNEQAFQGLHAEHILVLLDESSGIPTALWTAVETLMTSEHSRLLAIGNPDDPASDFAKKCTHWGKQEDANVIRISAFDTPAYTGEEVPDHVRRVLVTKKWVDDRTAEWGEESPLYVAKILGDFPDLSDDYLITPAMLRRGYETDLPGYVKGRYGLDIARLGAAKSVMYRNRGGQIRLTKWWAKKNTMQSVSEAMIILDRHPDNVPCIVDMVGIGSGVYDRLFQLGYEVGGYNGQFKPQDPTRFYNMRAENYWMFRKGLEDGDIDLDPEDEELAAQLTSIKWFINLRGQIQLETKEDMIERGLPSPDRADAAVMSLVHVGVLREQLTDPLLRESSDLLMKVM